MDVEIQVFLIKDVETVESKNFTGKNSVDKALEYLNRLKIKKYREM